ncbi:MAG: tRNA (N6-threonylcarbamoyladenosine(37)-N6)-methyltransferase TrmO [Bacteroidales bacterium]|nr:tRNA (N6-threonylcarbamoyladenosine(37)-N6)-methyltransferase TrmO [Bacteroidales bacterium]
MKPVALFRSPLPEKFGIPRQAGVVPQLKGEIRLIGEFAQPQALRGLEGFDYLWLIWEFSLNGDGDGSLTVRPPRLGGNERVGVFASRSPFRPNRLGLSSVRIEKINTQECSITVSGADLADGTPIYDIKPYVEYTDSHPGARCGFVDSNLWEPLEVAIPDCIAEYFDPSEIQALRSLLAQDPRPAYQDDPERIYGLAFGGRQVHFKVSGQKLTVTSCEI